MGRPRHHTTMGKLVSTITTTTTLQGLFTMTCMWLYTKHARMHRSHQCYTATPPRVNHPREYQLQSLPQFRSKLQGAPCLKGEGVGCSRMLTRLADAGILGCTSIAGSPRATTPSLSTVQGKPAAPPAPQIGWPCIATSRWLSPQAVEPPGCAYAPGFSGTLEPESPVSRACRSDSASFSSQHSLVSWTSTVRHNSSWTRSRPSSSCSLQCFWASWPSN